MAQYAVRIVTPVVIDDTELQTPGDQQEITDLALEDFLHWIENTQWNKEGNKVELQIDKV